MYIMLTLGIQTSSLQTYLRTVSQKREGGEMRIGKGGKEGQEGRGTERGRDREREGGTGRGRDREREGGRETKMRWRYDQSHK